MKPGGCVKAPRTKVLGWMSAVAGRHSWVLPFVIGFLACGIFPNPFFSLFLTFPLYLLPSSHGYESGPKVFFTYLIICITRIIFKPFFKIFGWVSLVSEVVFSIVMLIAFKVFLVAIISSASVVKFFLTTACIAFSPYPVSLTAA